MVMALRLDGADRELFRLVNEAAFINPFTVSRISLDQRIGGRAGVGLSGALQNVRRSLERLRSRDLLYIPKYEADDARLLEFSILFDVFHRWAPDFDRLIVRQERDLAVSLPAPFVMDAMQELGRAGMASVDVLRYVGMFYQLRRAFYFIRRELVGESPSMRTLRIACWNNVFTYDLSVYLRALVTRMEDFSTLLLGETGSGKGAVARAMGASGFIPYDPATRRFSENFSTSFIAINLAQYPESLVESELFGHKKGAFTGAITDRDGVFSRCRPHGAIFLDEIGDAPLPVQIKLLRVLQERTFSPVGSEVSRRFSGRVIAATNRPLKELRGNGRFREDFYYRLCSDVIEVPPLRTRLTEYAGELPRLVAAILEKQFGPDSSSGLLPRVLDSLEKQPGPGYPWPGNVRELEQAVRRVLLAGSYVPEDPAPAVPEKEPWLAHAAEGSLSADALMASYCGMLWRRHGSYEDVARRTGLDRRTAKKYVKWSEVEVGNRVTPQTEA